MAEQPDAWNISDLADLILGSTGAPSPNGPSLNSAQPRKRPPSHEDSDGEGSHGSILVLVNPTHVAVALRYDAKTMDAPVLVAKGAGEIAEKIREVARAYGVPVIRKPELARTIYSTVKLGGLIPHTLYLAVAEVLAMIYRLRNKNK